MEPSHESNPDEAVALGAAIYASDYFDKIQDVCSHSLGIISKNPKTGEHYNSIIIPRNTNLPVKMSKEYYTAPNMQKIYLEVTEGEDEDLEFVSILAGIDIKLPENTPKNTQVTVEMELNKNQLLHVYARIHTVPEIYHEVEIERKSNLDDEEIAEQTTLIEKKIIM